MLRLGARYGMQRMVLARTTLAHEADALALSHRLVETGVAVCVHVHGVSSTYRWKERIEEEPEWVVEARAFPSQLDDLRRAMLAGHPYELPLFEVVEVSVSGDYATWAKQGALNPAAH